MNLGRAEVLVEEARKRGWTHGAELGLWDGRTLNYLLEHVPALTMIGVDVFRDIGLPDYKDGAWDHRGNLDKVLAVADRYPTRALIYPMLTVEAAKLVGDGTLDFVFVDADHSAFGVKNDIAAWWPKLKSTGVMMGHDIDWPSVRGVVETCFPRYETRKDNVWMAVA